MNHHVQKILLAASILVLLASASDAGPPSGIDPAGAQEAKSPPGIQFEPRYPTPALEGNVGESRQAEQAAPSVEEEVSTAKPENIPSEEERNAILDRVNRGPEFSGSVEEAGEGPAPGTESHEGRRIRPPDPPSSIR